MNAVTKIEDRRKDRLRVRKATSHDPCLLSFRCRELADAEEVDDARVRWKGVLSYLDSFVDPLAGTRYVICVHPPAPQSPGKYFERAGKHMAWVMHSPEGKALVGDRRRLAKQR